MTAATQLTEAERNALRASGYRPVEAWVRDWSDPDLVARAKEQARTAARSGDEDETMTWVESVRGAIWNDVPPLDEEAS